MSTNATKAPAGRAAVPAIPFVGAANEHTEPFLDRTLTPGTAEQLLGPVDVPAYGYIRHIFIRVDVTGATLGAATLLADYPFSVFNELALLDVNGSPLFQLDGYDAFLANVIGGYAFRSDPRDDPSYVGTINASFGLRIPVEIAHHNGFGALANQHAAATYKLRARVSGTGSWYTGTIGTAPTGIRVRAWLEAWSLPPAADPLGRPQQVAPPRHGTAQYWSSTSIDVATGQQTVKVSRVGNLIRNLIFVVRDTNGARVASASLPDPIVLELDSRQLHNESPAYRLRRQQETMPAENDLPDGVLVYGFDNSVLGKSGDGSPITYLPTVQATRLDWRPTMGAAGSVDVIVNDIAPAEVNPAERYVETSETGFTPGQSYSM